MNEKELQSAIARALWEGYEYSLPDTPQRMAQFVVYRLGQTGLLNKGKTIND